MRKLAQALASEKGGALSDTVHFTSKPISPRSDVSHTYDSKRSRLVPQQDNHVFFHTGAGVSNNNLIARLRREKSIPKGVVVKPSSRNLVIIRASTDQLLDLFRHFERARGAITPFK